jgi:hypothetical protein
MQAAQDSTSPRAGRAPVEARIRGVCNRRRRSISGTTAQLCGDVGEPSAVPPATKTWLLPPSTPLCEVEFPTGGGYIVADNGDRASFGGNAHVSSTGDSSGEQQYRDHGPAQPLTVHSINVLAVVCVRFPDGHAEATIFGEATIDGSGRYAYRIDVEDRGEPGTTDTYWITLSNGYNSGRHPLEGGNITIH